MDEIKVLSPATVANVACGFDCLGFALTQPSDEMIIRKTEESGVRIIHRDNFGLPLAADENVAGVTLLSIFKAFQADCGFEVEITKHIRPGSGMGSSAASAAGAAVGANVLLGNPFSKTELVEFAMDGEKLAGGSRHADNVAPCIFGGFTLVRSKRPLEIVEVDFPRLFVTIVHPQLEVKTSDARKILKQKIELTEAVKQWSNIAALIVALERKNYPLLGRSMEDNIVEPIRKVLIPRFDEVRSRSLCAGAMGGGISGSGPSIFMFSENLETAKNVKLVMSEVYEEANLDFSIYISQINPKGVKSRF